MGDTSQVDVRVPEKLKLAVGAREKVSDSGSRNVAEMDARMVAVEVCPGLSVVEAVESRVAVPDALRVSVAVSNATADTEAVVLPVAELAAVAVQVPKGLLDRVLARVTKAEALRVAVGLGEEEVVRLRVEENVAVGMAVTERVRLGVDGDAEEEGREAVADDEAVAVPWTD